MIRKQRYLGKTQDRALKARAKELGISEAELVRRALDAALRPQENAYLVFPRRSALTQFLDNAKRISEGHHLPGSYRFDRDELYDAREGRWLKRR